MLTAKQQKL